MNIVILQVLNNLVWVILSILFCCLLVGIVLIVYVVQVNGKLVVGDIVGVQEFLVKVKKWVIWLVIVVVVVGVLYGILIVVFGGMGVMSNSGY